MPRNRSEKLPSCPQAHAYADACESVLNGNASSHKALLAWRAMPTHRLTEIDNAASTKARNWRRKRITFIRKNYAP